MPYESEWTTRKQRIDARLKKLGWKNPRLGGYAFETLADFENILMARMPQKPA